MECYANKVLQRAAGLGVAIVGAVSAWAPQAQYGARTIRDGVYTSAQAAQGERLFESICLNCHELTEFTGEGAYLAEVEGEPLWDTFEYIWAEMPEDDPASLDPEEYAAVLAFILRSYGLPPGDAALPIDRATLSAIVIAAP